MDHRIVHSILCVLPGSRWGGAVLLALIAFSCCGIVRGQDQFIPEIDVYDKLNSNIRLNFQAKETREAGDPTQVEVGPSLEFYVKPLVKLKDVKEFDLDDAKGRLLQVAVGYRYVPSPDKPSVQRMIVATTANFPLWKRFVLSDRNRFDLDWEQGAFTWRYRNRLNLERSTKVGAFHFSPYVAVEPYYLSQYQKWSTTAIYAGVIVPIKKHFQLDPYYEHQNITSKRPNEQLEQFGLILSMYFGH